MKPLEQRFWSKVRKTDSCWLWIAGKNRGYGHFYAHGKRLYAHRLSFEWERGPIHGKVLDHLCRIRNCVRLTECNSRFSAALDEAVRYLREGKQRFAPGTTNSFVDDFIARWGKKETNP